MHVCLMFHKLYDYGIANYLLMMNDYANELPPYYYYDKKLYRSNGIPC